MSSVECVTAVTATDVPLHTPHDFLRRKACALRDCFASGSWAFTYRGGPMSSNSILHTDNFPVGSRQRSTLKGHDVGSLGPSNSSDTGSDLAGVGSNSEEMTFAGSADEDMTG